MKEFVISLMIFSRLQLQAVESSVVVDVNFYCFRYFRHRRRLLLFVIIVVVVVVVVVVVIIIMVEFTVVDFH